MPEIHCRSTTTSKLPAVPRGGDVPVSAPDQHASDPASGPPDEPDPADSSHLRRDDRYAGEWFAPLLGPAGDAFPAGTSGPASSPDPAEPSGPSGPSSGPSGPSGPAGWRGS